MNGVYISKTDQALVSGIAQRDYDIKIVKTIKEELKRIDPLIRLYNRGTMESVYENMSDLRRPLIHPVVLSDDQYIDYWQNISYQKKEIHDDIPEYYTAKGERVRSKSEIIIADTLNRRNIPYRYEYPLHLQHFGTIHPDFTVLNVKERKEYYWEHMGMMDDPQYSESALDRIVQYERHGYYPGQKLIITHETSSSPLLTTIIDGMINHYLI